MNLNKGDIIAIMDKVYIDFPGGKWADHFVIKKTFYALRDVPDNNGNVKLKNCRGRFIWYNVNVMPFEFIKGKADA